MHQKIKSDILFLTKYGPRGASSRYRTLQYLPYLKSKGLTCIVSPLFDDAYLERKYKLGKGNFVDLSRAVCRRLRAMVSALRFEVVLVEYEILPFFPAFFERVLSKAGIKLVFDFDDAQFHRYDLHKNWYVRFLLGKKIGSMLRHASVVIVGNEYLAQYARRTASRVELIPTVIDVAKYEPSDFERGCEFTIGWIGTPLTAVYLQEIAPSLAQFFSESRGKLVIVGVDSIYMPGVPLELHAWDERTEVSLIQQFHVGIMPLPDTPYERGKCGLKLIQYMGCGKPVIASPVGINETLVNHGENGFLARCHADWKRYLIQLKRDDRMRREMGRKGRMLVASDYSLETQQARMGHLLKRVMGVGT